MTTQRLHTKNLAQLTEGVGHRVVVSTEDSRSFNCSVSEIEDTLDTFRIHLYATNISEPFQTCLMENMMINERSYRI